jgi:WD40 repeat protein
MINSPARPRGWLVLALLLSGFCFIAYADDLRTWTDKTGKFKVEAKFVGIENGKAILEKPDGTQVRIDLDKLSLGDRRHAEQLHKGMAKDDPFEKTTPTKPGRAGRRGVPATPPEGTPELTEVDWAGVKQLSIFGSDWKAPAITPTDHKLNWQPRPVSLPAKADFFENITGVVTSPPAKRAVVMTALERPGNRGDVQGRLFVCDLQQGKVILQFPYAGKMQPLALSHDGTRLIARHEVFGHDQSDKIELWKFGENTVERAKHWLPAEKPTERGRDVIWAAFSTDDKTLLTMTSGGALTWWDAENAKPTQTLALGGHIVPAPGISPDGKYLACVANQELVMLDASSGETVAVKSTGQHLHLPRLSFSPDGKKLACTTMNKLNVFSVAEGHLETSVAINGAGHQLPCFWTTPTAVLAGHPLSYVETSMNVNVWGYDGTDKIAPLGDHGVMVIGDGPRGAPSVIAVKLPHAGAVQLMEQAKKDPNFFVLKPGTRVSVDVQAISDATLRQEAKSSLETRLQENGHPLGAGGVTLVASLERGKDHEVSYRSFGQPLFDRGKTYTVTGWVYTLKVNAGGRTHWQTGGGNHPPPIIHLKQDESVESHLQKYNTPSAAFFKHVELPKYVARAQGNDAGGSTSLRRSQVTAAGLR